MAKAIMVQGTASGVGKTILTIALCHIFKQDGYSVAPFKSQNVTANTAFTKSGEIAVSQILQAYAAGIEPSYHMNPIILKYSVGNPGMQVILNGQNFDNINGYKFKKTRAGLIPEITKAYDSLSSKHDIIVIEGAGSPVELNLNQDDIVNMGIAKLTNAPVLLVSDIDRGGVFASLYGTVSLFSECERKYVKATIVNRFKGEASYFADGAAILEKITGLPVAGVIPHIPFRIPEEDGPDALAIDSPASRQAPDTGQALRDGHLQHISPDDFNSQFDLIAGKVRESLKMDLIYKILNDGV